MDLSSFILKIADLAEIDVDTRLAILVALWLEVFED